MKNLKSFILIASLFSISLLSNTNARNRYDRQKNMDSRYYDDYEDDGHYEDGNATGQNKNINMNSRTVTNNNSYIHFKLNVKQIVMGCAVCLVALMTLGTDDNIIKKLIEGIEGLINANDKMKFLKEGLGTNFSDNIGKTILLPIIVLCTIKFITWLFLEEEPSSN